jgi:hypothetical protein
MNVEALFDLSSDLGEMTNLAGNPDLSARIAQMHSDFDALMLLPRTAPAADLDADGVADEIDNCLRVHNPDQRDTNNDAFGNVCDADLDNDCVVNVADLGLLKSVFFSADADADFNGDGTVNTLDLGIMKASFFGAPGPSGAPNNCAMR